MKTIFKILVYFCCILGYAQVGIGTTTPNAQLDIQSSNQANPSNTDGILIPKIDAFPATNPGANQNGMLVFLTTTVGTNVPGFYYWNHPTAWVPIGNNSNSGWNLNGNAITAGQFIGTTNNQDLVLRRGNVFAGRISEISGASNTSYGVNALNLTTTGSANNAFGRSALRANTTGNSNNAFGTSAMFNNTEGLFNSAFGQSALSDNTTGDNNSAFGYMALRDNTLANQNSAFGRASLILNTIGDSNSGFGYNSLETNTVGSRNTALGSNSDVATNNLNNATAIGANAQVGTSNSMVLGSINGVNGATANVNVGIGTTTPQDRLHVVGNIRMIDGNEALGRVLTSDANGTATWQNASANAWGLNGNSGTNPTNNFFGTTDNQDVVFRRNNIISGRISINNNSFGPNALVSNTTGLSNNAFGRNTLTNNTTGSFNLAFGEATLMANENGSFNTGLGTNALRTNISGGGNTAVGYEALEGNTSGTSNTSIGFNSDVSINNLNNATAIGANAQVSASNSLVLGSINGINGATSDVNVGIGTTSPSRRLHVVNSGSSGGTPFGTAGFVLESNLQVYQQFLTPSNRESGLLFGNESSNIRAGILFNSGHPDGLSFRTGGNTTRMAITNAGDMGMGTLAPQAAMDIIANDNGVLIPRVILTAANVQAPVVNPTGGALPESTLVYNTNSSGTVPNDVTPGFYYWQNNRWNRLGNENKTRYYTAVGTTDSQFLAGTPSVLVPEMSVTLTPSSSTILVNFNASGFLFSNGANMLPNPNIESLPVVFFIALDGVFVRMFSTMTNSTFSNSNVGLWDIDFNYPITVQPGVSQTVSINYYPMIVSPAAFTSGDRIVFNMSVAAPPFNFSIPVQNHRVLTVIDP